MNRHKDMKFNLKIPRVTITKDSPLQQNLPQEIRRKL